MPCVHAEAGCEFVGRKVSTKEEEILNADDFQEELPLHLKQCVYEPIKEFIQRTRAQLKTLEEAVKAKDTDSEQLVATVRMLEEKSCASMIRVVLFDI